MSLQSIWKLQAWLTIGQHNNGNDLDMRMGTAQKNPEQLVTSILLFLNKCVNCA